LELLLLEAERAWAYSQELIALSSQPANKSKASTIAHSATGRFRRSVHWATQLLSNCQTLFISSRLSAENLVQATVYTLILNGGFLRYGDNFHDALIQLCVARSLLDELANTASSSRDQALATFFSDEIAPEIRHCAHELGRAKAYEISSIVASIAPIHKAEIVDGFDTLVEKLRLEAEAETKAASRRKLDTLMWEGQPVSVPNPELVDVLLKVQEAETKLNCQDAGAGLSVTQENDKKQKSVNAHGSKKGIAAYNTVLLALSDAEEVARRLTEAQHVSTSLVMLPLYSRDWFITDK
jgi:signal recognition particle subunit SRP68